METKAVWEWSVHDCMDGWMSVYYKIYVFCKFTEQLGPVVYVRYKTWLW